MEGADRPARQQQGSSMSMTGASTGLAGNLTDDPGPGHSRVVIVVTGSPTWRCIRCAVARR
jgi:hypothetical protein